MDDLQPKSAFSDPDSNNASAGVQSQLNLLRAGLVVLSGVFAVSIWVQVHYLRVERTNLQPILQSYDRDKQTIDPLLAKIAEYGRTRPAFAPIMQKYQLQVPTNVPVAPAAVKPSATKPAPPPAAVPKK